MHANVLNSYLLRPRSTPASSQAAPNHAVAVLDAAIPLRNASHRDVVHYAVETIWRKAECIATLIDGTKTKLRDSWQFIGYAGNDPVRILLFRSDESHIEIAAGANIVNLTPRAGIYTTVDGSQLSLAG